VSVRTPHAQQHCVRRGPANELRPAAWPSKSRHASD